MKFLFFNLLNDGVPMFMYPMLLMLVICVMLIIMVFVKGDRDEKLTKLIKHISLFALVYGFLGFMLGMIGGFDAMAIATSIDPSVLAGGLKIALLTPTFGMLIFLIARLGLIGLTFKNK